MSHRSSIPAALLVCGLLLSGCSSGPSSNGIADTPATVATTVGGESAAPAANPLLPPAWAAPEKCLSGSEVQQVLNTGKLLAGDATPDAICTYVEGGNAHAYSLAPDDTITDPSAHSTKAIYTPVPDLGSDALKTTLDQKSFGGKAAGVCRYEVRLDRDHGASKTSGDRLTVLMAVASRESADPESMCPTALKLLNAVSHRVAFASGFTPLPRYIVKCDISADAQAAKFSEFLKKTFSSSATWSDDPNFEAVAHPALYRLVERCGMEYAQNTVASVDAVGPTYDALSTWLAKV